MTTNNQARFPIDAYLSTVRGIPINNHPGAFGFRRKHDVHTGVDLYCNDGVPVMAIWAGTVVSVEPFTGKIDQSPWWEDIYAVVIESEKYSICYGEIMPTVTVGTVVQSKDVIGNVKRVLKEGKERPDIPGHSTSMLHIEMYQDRTVASTPWHLDAPKPEYLLDPTPLLLYSIRTAPLPILTMDSPYMTNEVDTRCDDCLKETSHRKVIENEMYMVNWLVWQQATRSKPATILCIGCLEARIGRLLNKHDFKDVPLNHSAGKSPRLMDRMTREQ
jgi:hypothetical protein